LSVTVVNSVISFIDREQRERRETNEGKVSVIE